MSLMNIPHWIIAELSLVIISLFFKLCMRGYGYISFSFFFAAMLLLIQRFAPVSLWHGVLTAVLVGFIYFLFLEVLIIQNSKGDMDIEKDYLILLGARVIEHTPSLALTHRMEGAIKYLSLHPNTVAILSGGQGKDEIISEAECMFRWLTEHGIDAKRLIKESGSHTTMENLHNSFEIIRSRGDDPNGNTAILSSAYHLYRAKSMAKLQGVSATTVAGNTGYPIYMLNCYIREAFGLTHLWVFKK